MMSKTQKKVCSFLNYIEHLLLILSSAVIGCVSISAFTSLIPIGIASSAIVIKICELTARAKKYKSIIKKKKKKHNKIVLLAKTKLSSIEVLISKALINVSVNNASREYDHMKEKIINLETSTDHQSFLSIYKTTLLYCLKCRKNRK